MGVASLKTVWPPSLRYKLVHDPASWVTVDERSGVVVTRQQLARESPHVNNGMYIIIVHAVDEGKCSPKLRESVSLLLQKNNTGSLSTHGEKANLSALSHYRVFAMHTGDHSQDRGECSEGRLHP